MRLSVIVEWSNALFSGESRAAEMLARLGRQWREVRERDLPPDLAPEGRAFLEGLAPGVEVVLVSPEPCEARLVDLLRARLPEGFDVALHVAGGLDYYPLKNRGAREARGDILLFVDSDVLPERGWLAHLLGTFGREGVDVVCGLPYVAPEDLYSRAFALAWTYRIQDETDAMPALDRPRKFYSNNIAFRAEVLRRVPFPEIGRRSRGSTPLLLERLAAIGIPIWENRRARVAHPPPPGLERMVAHALAYGRDHYMKVTEDGRSLAALRTSLGVASERWTHGLGRARRSWRSLGLRPHEVPAAVAIHSCYYAMFAAGGVMTFAWPEWMGRRFRI